MIYCTYGKSTHLNLPYRVDKCAIGADFVTVGKIDNSFKGEYSSNKKMSYTKILIDFHYKSEKQKLRQLTQQFILEKEYVYSRIKNWMIHTSKPLIIEITNEPNLFPYLKPKTYAEYYTLWYDYIKKNFPTAKIMNGGLWIYASTPKVIRKGLSLLNIKYQTAYDYYHEFLNYVDYRKHPDIINIHYYPMAQNWYDINDFEIELFTFLEKDVWITEFGNINPFDMNTTVKFIRKLLITFDYHNIENDVIKRVYYFKASGNDSKFNLFYELNKKVKKKKSLLRFLSYIFRRKTSLLYILYKYVVSPPIQTLENEKGLNKIGKMYKRYSEKNL